MIFILLLLTATDKMSCTTQNEDNETPTVRGPAADNNNKLYTETMIFLIGVDVYYINTY